MERNRDGFFLVGVLVFLFILIPVIALFAQSSRAVAKSTSAADQRFRIAFLASGLAEALASRLTSDRDLVNRFRSEGAIGCVLGQRLFQFRIGDHDGKIDLNNAGSELLKAGFKAAGLSDDNAETLQQFTEAFRSNASMPDAAQASDLPSLKHAPFERIDELNDAISALKLAPIDFGPYFTVYKRAGNLEYDSASASLKAAVDASPEIREQVATDNGSFDYIDVTVDVTQANAGRFALMNTYMRLAAAGEVRAIASKNLSTGGAAVALNPETPTATCGALLGIGEAGKLDG